MRRLGIVWLAVLLLGRGPLMAVQVGDLVFNVAGTWYWTDPDGNPRPAPAGSPTRTNQAEGNSCLRATQPGGQFILAEQNFGIVDAHLYGYDADMTPFFNLDYGNPASSACAVALGGPQGVAWAQVVHPVSTVTISKYNLTNGAILDTKSFALTGGSATPPMLAVNPAGTIAYFSRDGRYIFACDLVGGGVSTFKDAGAIFHYGLNASGIVVLADGTILTAYDDFTNVSIVGYDAGGSTTYGPFAVSSDASEFFLALSEGIDSTTYWVITENFNTNIVTIRNIRRSDNAVLHTFTRVDDGGTGPNSWGQVNMTIVRVALPRFKDAPQSPPSIPVTGTSGAAACKPTTTVLRSPQPTPGCNQGGMGWTASYTSASGVVPVGPDPPVGEILTGKPGVHVWAELTHVTNFPTGNTTETIRHALTELDDVARKEGRLLSIGTVEHGLSDGQGNLTASTIDVSSSDIVGRPIGTRMVDPARRYFQRDEMAVFAASIKGRRTGATPVRIGRGLLQEDDYGTGDGSQGGAVVSWSAVDPFFCDGGAYGPDKKVPMWTVPTLYLNAPTDVYSKYLPIILGEVSDEGAVDQVTNLPNSRGLCPLIFTGIDPLATGPGGTAENWGGFIVCLFPAYKMVGLYGADLSNFLYGIANATSNGANPSVIQLPATVDLTPVLNALATPVPAGSASNPLLNLTLFTGLGMGAVVSQITAADNTAKTVTISATVPAGDTFGFNTLAGIASGVDWIIGQQPSGRTKIDLNTRNGQDCMVWGYPNYIRPTTYEDAMGSDGEVYRLQTVWIRGPLLEAHLSGQVTLAANVIGVEDKGDGTGLPITDYFTAYNWFLENCVIVNSKFPKGPGGLWPQTDGDLATFADGTYMIKGSTFVAAQAAAVAGFGGPFKIGAYFADGIATRDAMQLWNDNGNCRTGENEHGQIIVFYLNRLADTTTWPRVDHVNRIFGQVARTHPNDEIENVVQGQCDWDPDAGSYRNPLVQLVSASGVQHNGNIRKLSKLIDGKLTRNPLQFNYVLQQRLAYAQDGPVYCTITGDIGLLDIGIGTGFQFTSPMGPGPAGYEEQPMVILDKQFLVDSHQVTLTCLDVGGGSGTGLIVPPGINRFTITNTLANEPVITDTPANEPLIVNI